MLARMLFSDIQAVEGYHSLYKQLLLMCKHICIGLASARLQLTKEMNCGSRDGFMRWADLEPVARQILMDSVENYDNGKAVDATYHARFSAVAPAQGLMAGAELAENYKAAKPIGHEPEQLRVAAKASLFLHRHFKVSTGRICFSMGETKAQAGQAMFLVLDKSYSLSGLIELRCLEQVFAGAGPVCLVVKFVIPLQHSSSMDYFLKMDLQIIPALHLWLHKLEWDYDPDDEGGGLVAQIKSSEKIAWPSVVARQPGPKRRKTDDAAGPGGGSASGEGGGGGLAGAAATGAGSSSSSSGAAAAPSGCGAAAVGGAGGDAAPLPEDAVEEALERGDEDDELLDALAEALMGRAEGEAGEAEDQEEQWSAQDIAETMENVIRKNEQKQIAEAIEEGGATFVAAALAAVDQALDANPPMSAEDAEVEAAYGAAQLAGLLPAAEEQSAGFGEVAACGSQVAGNAFCHAWLECVLDNAGVIVDCGHAMDHVKLGRTSAPPYELAVLANSREVEVVQLQVIAGLGPELLAKGRTCRVHCDDPANLDAPRYVVFPAGRKLESFGVDMWYVVRPTVGAFISKENEKSGLRTKLPQSVVKLMRMWSAALRANVHTGATDCLGSCYECRGVSYSYICSAHMLFSFVSFVFLLVFILSTVNQNDRFEKPFKP